MIKSEFYLVKRGPVLGAFLGLFDQLKSVQLVIGDFLISVSQSVVIPLSKNKGCPIRNWTPLLLTWGSDYYPVGQLVKGSWSA